MPYLYHTKGVCPSTITISLNGNIIEDVHFEGGCDGNLKAISRLAKGMTVAEAEQAFSDLTCEDKNTCCSAQLAKAARAAYEAEKEKG